MRVLVTSAYRVCVIHIRLDLNEWLEWSRENGIRSEVRSFISFMPEALMRPVPRDPIPFSTPRSWALVSEALDLAEQGGLLNQDVRRALLFGRVSPEDAAIFCVMTETKLEDIPAPEDCIRDPMRLPGQPTSRWFLISRVRQLVQRGKLQDFAPEVINNFLRQVPSEFRCALLVDLIEPWGEAGADTALLETLKEVTGL